MTWAFLKPDPSQKQETLISLGHTNSFRESNHQTRDKKKENKMEGGEESVEIENSKDLQQQSKALDKLTDHHDDNHRQLDSTRVQEAMASIAASKEADLNAMRLREKELAAVKINPAEVDIIANELELDKKVAERTLREHKGDAVAAIRHLIQVGNL